MQASTALRWQQRFFTTPTKASQGLCMMFLAPAQVRDGSNTLILYPVSQIDVNHR